MPNSHSDGRNWGRIAAIPVLLFGSLGLLIVFGGLMMGGGGCEGRPVPCTPDHASVWPVMALLAAAVLAIAAAAYYGINRLVFLRRRSRSRETASDTRDMR